MKEELATLRFVPLYTFESILYAIEFQAKRDCSEDREDIIRLMEIIKAGNIQIKCEEGYLEFHHPQILHDQVIRAEMTVQQMSECIQFLVARYEKVCCHAERGGLLLVRSDMMEHLRQVSEEEMTN